MYSLEIETLAAWCVRESEKPRPEVLQVKQWYERFRKTYQLASKESADAFLYGKMYGKKPEKPSDLLKIRYWRTGRHIPVNREQCRAFGQALELTPEEELWLMQYYYDRSDRVFETEDTTGQEYRIRREIMDAMTEEYLKKIHPSRFIQLHIFPEKIRENMRHLYFTDAGQYVFEEKTKRNFEDHIISAGYGTELGRNLKLLGEIPRKTMLRHLILLGMPYLSRELLDKRFKGLGYAPLQEEHTLTDGGRLDGLLIRLLELYDQNCTGKEPEECMLWFQKSCRELDRYFTEHGKKNLRFMYFKALQ